MRRSVIVSLTLVLGSCGSSGNAGLPDPVMSQAEIERLEHEALAFADRHMGAWPDVDAFVADYAEQMDSADPTHSDYGPDTKQAATNMWRTWESMTAYTIEVTDVYLSADGAAFEQAWPGLWPSDTGWPVAAPKDPAGPRALETYRFSDGKIASFEVWYPPDDNELFGFGCFAVDGCPELDEFLDEYLAAWSARDPGAIAALYADDAQFTDSILGLDANGQDAIADLADLRFGSGRDLTIEVLDVYTWTLGHNPPTPSRPERGRLIGVALHYRAFLDGEGGTQEGIITLERGTMHEQSFDADPDGLIHSEEVYHAHDSLLAAQQP